MIITEINGGLGNQMFQYACGRALAHKNKECLYIDTQSLANAKTTAEFTARPYGLGIFNIQTEEAPRSIRSRFFPKAIPLKVLYKWILNYKIYTEPAFYFNKEIFEVKGNIFLRGYWQTEKYFEAAEDIIRKDFAFEKKKNEETLALADSIQHTNAVSLHVRRGDYVSSLSANSFHGLAGLEYYRKAIALIKEKTADPFFYIFSDDAAWAEEHLAKGNSDTLVVKHNTGEDSWQDMYLMSICNHHIIANSSFSWWGAWLNNKENKIVIAPKIWFADEKMNKQTGDLKPADWLEI
jgi:hypothetical protein